ncbi:unnamed protein product, partial [Rotaria sp. Silwood2]
MLKHIEVRWLSLVQSIEHLIAARQLLKFT